MANSNDQLYLMIIIFIYFLKPPQDRPLHGHRPRNGFFRQKLTFKRTSVHNGCQPEVNTPNENPPEDILGF